MRVESAGGTVTGYGLAAAQLTRLRERKVKVTACVDQVAASGGYLMACAADRIVAAPFAILGSIGVVAQVPNLHRLLKKNDIDYEEMTAGEFKRSVSVLGEITPEGREHFRGKLDSTHEAFKRFVQQCRPGVDIARVGDGDVWLGGEALALGLVDALSTSDELLFAARGEARLSRSPSNGASPCMQQIRRRLRRGGALRPRTRRGAPRGHAELGRRRRAPSPRLRGEGDRRDRWSHPGRPAAQFTFGPSRRRARPAFRRRSSPGSIADRPPTPGRGPRPAAAFGRKSFMSKTKKPVRWPLSRVK